MTLGLARRTVRIVPHDPTWTHAFERERELLRASLGGLPAAIEHVGSTAVVDLAAKPILDLMIGTPAGAELMPYRVALEHVRYEYRGELGIPGRHFFGKGQPRTHHVHLVIVHSDFWRSHLLFREHLRRHPDVAQAYGTLKLELAARHPNDREAYTAGKAAFIERTLWAAERHEA